VSRELKLLLF